MKRDELERQSLVLHRQSLQGVGGWETFRARERSAGNDARSALLAQLEVCRRWRGPVELQKLRRNGRYVKKLTLGRSAFVRPSPPGTSRG